MASKRDRMLATMQDQFWAAAWYGVLLLAIGAFQIGIPADLRREWMIIPDRPETVVTNSVSAMLMHHTTAHWQSNVTCLIALAMPALLLGARILVLTTAMAVVANIAASSFQALTNVAGVVSCGASTLVFALIGCTTWALVIRAPVRWSWVIRFGIALQVGLVFVLGLITNPWALIPTDMQVTGVNWIAHWAGLISGMLVGTVAVRFRAHLLEPFPFGPWWGELPPLEESGVWPKPRPTDHETPTGAGHSPP
jgi:membrane associated rhomboid family serine protease